MKTKCHQTPLDPLQTACTIKCKCKLHTKCKVSNILTLNDSHFLNLTVSHKYLNQPIRWCFSSHCFRVKSHQIALWDLKVKHSLPMNWKWCTLQAVQRNTPSPLYSVITDTMWTKRWTKTDKKVYHKSHKASLTTKPWADQLYFNLHSIWTI